jgi:hypothetical protein
LKLKVQNELVKKVDENNSQNIQKLPTLKVLQNIRSEALAAKDSSKDDILDLFKEYKNQNNLDGKYIQKIDYIPFSTILFMENNFDILKDALKTNKLIFLHLDATGGIVRKIHEAPLLHHVLLLATKSNDLNNSHILLNIGEMITEDQSSFNLKYFLELILNKFRIRTRESRMAFAIVTDKSYANINAIIASQNSMDLPQYLKVCYNICLEPDSHGELPVLCMLCSSHLSKNWKRDILKFFGKLPRDKIRFICSLIGNLMTIRCYKDLSDYIKTLISFFLTSRKNDNYFKILIRLEGYSKQDNALIISDDEIDGATNVNVDSIAENLDNKSQSIYSESPFYKSYKKVYDSTINEMRKECDTGDLNEYYNPKYMEDLLKKTIAILPLWAAVLPCLKMKTSDIYKRPNNGMVEGYFGENKSSIRDDASLGHIGQLKIGRYTRYMKEKIQIDSKKIRIGLPESRKKTKKALTSSALNQSQENWKGKSKSSSSIMFNNKNMSKELGLYKFYFPVIF